MPEPSYDGFDLHILRALQDEGRLANAELADRIHLSPTPCLRRVKALQREGVILGYQARLDREKVGLGLTILVGVKVDGHTGANETAIEDVFRGMPEVVSCHLVSGEYDFLLECVFPDMARYEQFLVGRLIKLPMVKDVRSTFVIRTVKSGAPLPLDHLMLV
jgi:Lrp/AsnC family leucine-responsive transcriptional regulator